MNIFLCRHYFVVKYKDAVKAQTALALDHTELMGRMIRVTKTKPSPAVIAPPVWHKWCIIRVSVVTIADCMYFFFIFFVTSSIHTPV